jgi:hypothetical protein
MKPLFFGCSKFQGRRNEKFASRTATCVLLAFLGAQSLHGAGYQSRTNAPAPRPPASSNSPQTQTKPSLDALVHRVKAYWSLLAQNNKRRAVEYVETSCRDYFLSRPFPNFSAPRVTKLELAESDKEVAVTVTVKRRLGTLPGEFDFPVMNRWIFSRGNWWLIAKDSPAPEALGMHAADGRSISPEEVEKQKAFIRSHLAFASDTIDFGTVRKGQWADFAIAYQWTGDQPVEAALQPGPVQLVGFPERKLLPGSNQQISLKMQTTDLEGQFRDAFRILVTSQGIGVSYEFKLQGDVYVPLSVIPSVLRFRADESEKELTIINNSSSEVRLDSVQSESKGYAVRPLPQNLSPGARCVLKVRMLLTSPEKNQTERIYIMLANPVDEMASVPLSVIANADETPKQKEFKDLTAKDIEELLRKSGLSPIKP